MREYHVRYNNVQVFTDHHQSSARNWIIEKKRIYKGPFCDLALEEEIIDKGEENFTVSCTTADSKIDVGVSRWEVSSVNIKSLPL